MVAPKGACMVAQGHVHGCSQGGGTCMVAPRGACVVALGGAWLLQGREDMGGCSGGGGVGGGACVVAPRGACVVAPRGDMPGCSEGYVWLLWGACMVALGGMHGCYWGACVVAPRGEQAWDTTRYRDTINERALRILLECILVFE